MEQFRCCPPAESAHGSRVSRCQTCGTAGTAVDFLTVKALVTDQALRRLDVTDYRFCAEAGCEVVYFGSSGQTFTVTDMRVPVWQKQPFGQRMVCYCFDENEAAIRVEIEQHGKSEAAERVRHHIGAGRCACEVRSPRGSCCLGDVTAAVKRVALAVQSSQGT
jgi:hypothetical protein